jgi:hypothetical protein
MHQIIYIYIYIFFFCLNLKYPHVSVVLTIIRVRCYRVSNITLCAFVQGVIVYKYILHNPNIVWCADNYKDATSIYYLFIYLVARDSSITITTQYVMNGPLIESR